MNNDILKEVSSPTNMYIKGLSSINLEEDFIIKINNFINRYIFLDNKIQKFIHLKYNKS